MNSDQFVCAAKVIGYSNLIIQSRNINGMAKRKIIDALCDIFATIRGMDKAQLETVEQKYSSLAQQILGADGLDAEEIEQLQEVAGRIEMGAELMGQGG
jgi:hypothetical protein